MTKFRIDRTKLPYDAMVADASWLAKTEDIDGGENTDGNEETKKVQTDKIQGKGQPL